LGKIPEAGIRRRAEQLYQQLDMLQHLRPQARRELLAESRKHTITAKLRQIPCLGPIRSDQNRRARTLKSLSRTASLWPPVSTLEYTELLTKYEVLH
jgi:hypothetical protein